MAYFLIHLLNMPRDDAYFVNDFRDRQVLQCQAVWVTLCEWFADLRCVTCV